MNTPETLNASVAIVDSKGRPLLGFQKQYQTAIQQLRAQIADLSAIVASIVAVEAAVATVETAVTTVETLVDDLGGGVLIIDERTENARQFLAYQ